MISATSRVRKQAPSGSRQYITFRVVKGTQETIPALPIQRIGPDSFATKCASSQKVTKVQELRKRVLRNAQSRWPHLRKPHHTFFGRTPPRYWLNAREPGTTCGANKHLSTFVSFLCHIEHYVCCLFYTHFKIGALQKTLDPFRMVWKPETSQLLLRLQPKAVLQL